MPNTPTFSSHTVNQLDSTIIAEKAAGLSEPQINSRYIAIIALLQGIILAYLYQSVEQQIWPGINLTWLTALATFFISLPSLFLLIASKSDYKAVIKGLLPFTLLISTLGAYIGNQQSAYPDIDSTFAVFTFAILIACFKAIMYIKLLANKRDINYQSLFLASWRNAIIFAAMLLFTALFFGILQLGAALFDLLGIELFTQLLREEWFWLPALTLASAFAIHIFRKISYLADNISTILQTLMKFLLPLLVFVSLGFLFTLPFTGLEKLWATRAGTFLLLWLTALCLFFVNAIYHKGNDNQPYHLFVHRFILAGIAILPIYSAISAYGLFTRIAQYGFTPDRLWALSIWFLLSCFTLGYLVGIVKLRDQWLHVQSKVNVAMGLVLLAFVLLVNSPILNFKGISTQSQMARYYSGEVTLDDLDITYFSHNLGKPGYLAMQQLKAEITETHPETVAIIDKQYQYIQDRINRRQATNKDEIDSQVEVTYWPNQHAFDADLIANLDKVENQAKWASHEYRLSIDLNQDGQPELIRIIDRSQYFQATLWQKTENDWHSTHITMTMPTNKDLDYSLKNHKIKLIESEYKILDLDGILINAN